jgi:hypothetical protein
VDACNPLLQAHPTWARDKHEGRGFPLFMPISPLRAPSRADPSGLGHAATIYSSVQGPTGVETPTNGLRIADELGVRRLDARGDSQLVIDQVMKNSHCRDRKMEAYCDEV